MQLASSTHVDPQSPIQFRKLIISLEFLESAGHTLAYQMLSAGVEVLASLSQKCPDENKCEKQLEGVMLFDGDGCWALDQL